MKDLLDAIRTKYLIDDSAGTGAFVALRAANTGGLHLVRATEDLSFPYITFMHVVGAISYTSTSTLKDATVQFSIFDETFATVMTLYNLLNTAFNNTVLIYDNDSPLVMQHVNETGPFKFEDVWQVTVDYQVMREA